jgi:zinc protease
MKLNKIIILYLLLTSAILFPQVQDSMETDPVNITAMAVIQKYIFAIGGIDNFKNVIDRTTVMSGLAMNQPIAITIKQKYPNKLLQELSVGEMNQIIYYTDGKGTLKIGNEITEIEGKELERLKIDASMQFLLDPESYGIKTEVLPNEFVDSVDCFVIKFTLPSGIRWFQYFNVETGLKFKETKEIQTKQGLFEQDNYFSDYREVEGIKYPFKIKQYLGLQEIELTVTSIEINTGLDDKLFELPD